MANLHFNGLCFESGSMVKLGFNGYVSKWPRCGYVSCYRDSFILPLLTLNSVSGLGFEGVSMAELHFNGLYFNWVSLVKLGFSGLCFEWGSMVKLGFNGLCFKLT